MEKEKPAKQTPTPQPYRPGLKIVDGRWDVPPEYIRWLGSLVSSQEAENAHEGGDNVRRELSTEERVCLAYDDLVANRAEKCPDCRQVAAQVWGTNSNYLKQFGHLPRDLKVRVRNGLKLRKAVRIAKAATKN